MTNLSAIQSTTIHFQYSFLREESCDELVCHIFSYLSPFELCFAKLVCKRWMILAQDSKFWQRYLSCLTVPFNLHIEDDTLLQSVVFGLIKNQHTVDRLIRSGQPHILKVKKLKQQICSLQLSGHKMLAAYGNGKACLLDLKTRKIKKKFKGHKSHINALAFSTDQFVSGSSDRSFRKWSLKSGKCEKDITVEKPVTSIASYQNLCFVGSYDLFLGIWDLKENRQKMKLYGWESKVSRFSISKNQVSWCRSVARPKFALHSPTDFAMTQIKVVEHWCFASSEDSSSIRVFDWEQTKMTKKLNAHRNGITGLSYSCNLLASGGKDASVKLWDFRVSKPVMHINTASYPTSVQLKGTFLIGGFTESKNIMGWDLRIPQELFNVETPSPLTHMDWNNEYLVFSCLDRRIYQLRRKTRSFRAEM